MARRDWRITTPPSGISSSSASCDDATSAVIESSAHVGRRPRDVEGVVQAGRHAGLQEPGQQDLVEVGVLEAHRDAVGAAQPLPVDDGVAGSHGERAGDAGAGLLAAGEQRLRLGQQAAGRHLLGVAQQPADVAARRGDEGAPTGDPLEQALRDQGVHRLPDRHPGDVELVDQLALGGRGRPGGGVVHQTPNVFTDLDVLRHARAGQ